MITVLTGISHEKLQPLHRWTAWIMCETADLPRTTPADDDLHADVLALIHTVRDPDQRIDDRNLTPT